MSTRWYVPTADYCRWTKFKHSCNNAFRLPLQVSHLPKRKPATEGVFTKLLDEISTFTTQAAPKYSTISMLHGNDQVRCEELFRKDLQYPCC